MNSKEGQTYSFAADVGEILGGSVFWKEVAIVVILTALYCLINPLLLVINLPLFLIFNFWSHAHLHRTWLKNRLHM